MVRVVEDPTGQALNTDYVFDTLGNLRKTIQGEQNRFFMHDSLGRLLYAKQPEQDTRSAFVATDPVTGNTAWSVKYEYDNNSNITKTTDARGIEVTGSYDNLNRIKLRDYSDATPDVSFYYDGTGLGSVPAHSKGKTTKVSSSVSETRFMTFDEFGRVKTHRQTTDGTNYDTAYTYNLSGALIEETYPSTRVVKYTLDQNGDLAQVQSKKTANHGYSTYADSFSYDPADAIKKMQLGNGRWETFVYNERLQIKQIGLGTTDADQNLLKLELGYGTSTQNNGSLREQKITVPGIANPFIQTYSYDDLNRLKSATETNGGSETWKQTFEIDRYGNREFDAANTTTLGGCATAVCNPNINTSDNRFSAAQGYSYDLNGNVTQDAAGQRFGYDAENHQKEFFAAGNGTSTPDATYLYDGEGRRVKKTSNTETTVFVYNATGQLVAEYSTQTAQTPQVSYLTTDHLGSPRVITNENGTVKDRKDYSAFGEESISAQRSANSEYSAADQLRKNYTGYEKDGESGLEFAQARYYSPTHGRYTSVDPLTASASIRNPQTFNRYSYVLNSPYEFNDPLGLLASFTGACGQWCGGSGSFVDGSALRGRDASFDWATEWFGEVVGYELNSVLEHESIHALQTDSRPYIGSMLSKNEDAGWDPAPGYGNIPEGARRFGDGHDGEHWLSKTPGAEIRMIAGLSGTILTRISQGDGLNTVLILIEKTSVVLILKDVMNLSKTVQGAPSALRFTDKKGNPISKVMIKAGELIGKTMPWTNGVGTFHFAFIKQEFAQQWRTELRDAVNAKHNYTPAEESRTELKKGVRYLKGSHTARASPLSWWIVPCGSSSPARCK